MSRPVKTIGETTTSEFLSDRIPHSNDLPDCDVIHFTDGLIREGCIEEAINYLRQISPVKASIKLSMSFRGVRGSRAINSHVANFSPGFLDKIKRAIDFLDYVDLDSDSDLTPQVLSIIPPHKRIITSRVKTTGSNVSAFQSMLKQHQSLSNINAFLYRFISDDGLAAVEFLHHIKQKNVVAYDDHDDALWSRICAPYRGASVIFARLDKSCPTSLDRLHKTFYLRDLPESIDRIYGIAGPSVNSSFSPMVHNKGLRELQIPAIYLPFKLHDLKTLDKYIFRLKNIGLPIQGLTINAPLKGTVNTAYNASRAIIEKTRSANVLVMKNGEGVVDTTDDLGLIHVLEQHQISVLGKRVAIIGCGCSGRVAAYTLRGLGAEVVLYNRGPERGKLAEQLLQLRYYPLEQLDPHGFDLLVNTAPFAGHKDLTFSIERLNPKSVVIDFVYTPYPNSFIAYAKLKGLEIIDGFEVLNGQLLSQFQSLTGHALPREASRVLKEILKGRKKTSTTAVEFINEPIVNKRMHPARVVQV